MISVKFLFEQEGTETTEVFFFLSALSAISCSMLVAALPR
jgi:hypothetical protein